MLLSSGNFTFTSASFKITKLEHILLNGFIVNFMSLQYSLCCIEAEYMPTCIGKKYF